MNKKTFIKKALKGGAYKGHEEHKYGVIKDGHLWEIHAIVLNPEAWEAVGKIEGWSQSIRWGGERTTDAHRRAVLFMTKLFDGIGLEKALNEATS